MVEKAKVPAVASASKHRVLTFTGQDYDLIIDIAALWKKADKSWPAVKANCKEHGCKLNNIL